MRIDHHTLKIQRTAHVYTSGTLTPATNELWFLLHGYSQEADVFLREFEILADDTRFLIAPQGLSQFYSSGTGGRTAASWMTRSHRDDEIHDYLNYLDHVLYDWIDKFSHKPNLCLLGFSQGSETASRWFVSTNYRFDHLIICSGLIPHDIDIPEFQKRISAAKLSLIHGSNDRLIPGEIREELYKYMNDNSVKHSQTIFPGGHRIDPASVLKICSS